MYFHTFLKIFTDFHGFRGIGAEDGKSGPAVPKETFARFQVGVVSSDDFYRIFLIFMDFETYSPGFSLIFIISS